VLNFPSFVQSQSKFNERFCTTFRDSSMSVAEVFYFVGTILDFNWNINVVELTHTSVTRIGTDVSLAGQAVAAWDRPFQSDDDAQGGCPPI
jgi:hypothetical protein